MTDREIMKQALEALRTLHDENMDFLTRNKLDGENNQCMVFARETITALRKRLAQPDPFNCLVRIMGTFDLATGHADNWNDLLDSLESDLLDVLGHYREALKVGQEPVAWMYEDELPESYPYDLMYPYSKVDGVRLFPLYSAPPKQPECNPHPDAPHGFNRESSHSLGRYVCDCEGWEPEQKPVAWWNPRYGKGEYAFAEEQSPPDDPNDQSDFGWNIPLYAVPLKQQEYGCTECGKLASDGWALYCVECLVSPEKEWVGLTGDEVNDLKHWLDHRAQWSYIEFAHAIEAKLKEKNT